MLLNNLCESFNAAIIGARDKPILSMLEDIMVYIMRRLNTRQYMERWTGEICPNAFRILEKNKYEVRACMANWAGLSKFEIKTMYGDQYVVDLAAKTCSCRRWDLIGIPCSHSVAAIYRKNLEPTDFVHEYYMKKTYQQSYQFIINPMSGQDLWTESGLAPIIPPSYHKQPGRPKKVRRREADELSNSSQKMRRLFAVITCTKCGREGHNVRTCYMKKQVQRQGSKKKK